MTAEGATVGDVLRAWTAATPDVPLVIAPETERTLSYRDLAEATAALAAYLEARGIRPGARVALYLHNGRQTAALFLGLMAAGYVVAPFNLLAHKSQLAWTIAHSEVRLVFTTASLAAQLADALVSVEAPPLVEVIDVDAAALFPPAGPFEPPPQTAARDVALLMYTSGTTGVPKGVLLTHANLLAGARAVAGWHGLSPQDRVLSALPLYHINGQVIATLAPFVSGGSIVAPHRFSASVWWPLVAKYDCTWINMVPTIIAYLLAGPDAGPFPRVRFGRSASAPLPPEQCVAFEQRFGIPVVEAMGMTECASTVFCNPHDARRRAGSPGLPCGVEAGIIGPDGRHLETGVTGEIVLRGPNVMVGYLGASDKTAEAIDGDGWLRTGDLGYRDADGFYYVTGRLKELIIKGGENIAPREIDEVLLRHPAVLEAAAFAVPHPHYGQDIAAAVIAKPDTVIDPSALEHWCVGELGRYKAPTRIHVVTELPKGPSGKIQRLKLADVLQKA